METTVKKDLIPKSYSAPMFISKSLLKPEQINDPDYRLKHLEKLFGTKYPISCSKCHHCR
jgi:hypothetical protein